MNKCWVVLATILLLGLSGCSEEETLNCQDFNGHILIYDRIDYYVEQIHREFGLPFDEPESRQIRQSVRFFDAIPVEPKDDPNFLQCQVYVSVGDPELGGYEFFYLTSTATSDIQVDVSPSMAHRVWQRMNDLNGYGISL